MYRAYDFEGFTLDLTQGRLLRDGQAVRLRPKSFETLSYLVQNSGRLITKDELLHAIWPDSFVSDESVVKCVTDVRTALNDESHRILQTVARRGYIFNGKVERAVHSIAVLPFRVLGGEDEQYLGLGIADALITRLSRLQRVIVRPTSAVAKYATQIGDPVTAGLELRVDFLIEGTVHRAGQDTRITVQLVETKDGTPTWADGFDSASQDVLTLQDTITERIAKEVLPRLTREERKVLTRRDTDDGVAYRLYLKGRYCWNQGTYEWLTKGIAYFEQATAHDPRYALAYTGIADSYLVLGSWATGALRPREAYPKAKAAALEALRLDATLPEAHTSLAAVVKVFDWNWPEAEKGFKRAIELGPTYATAHQWYAMYLAAMGRLDEALTEIRLAHGLDPISHAIARDLGRVYFFTRQYPLAVAELEQTLELEPGFSPALYFLGLAYAQLTRYDESIEVLERAAEATRRKAHLVAALGHSYAISGKADQAAGLLSELERRSETEYVSAYNLAVVHAGLRHKDEALACLEQTFEERSNWLVFLRGEARLDGLRDDPRFSSLARRVGLADAAGQDAAVPLPSSQRTDDEEGLSA